MLLSAVPLAGTFAQAVLGGITVLTGLNPVTVASPLPALSGDHRGQSAARLAARESADQPLVKLGVPAVRVLSKVLLVVGLLVLTLGTVVTGSGPHSGDADAASRFPFDPRTVSWLHADVVILFIGLTVGLFDRLVGDGSPRRAVNAVWWLLGLSLAQGLIGYVQYFTALPWVLVSLHLLGSALVWIALLRVPLTLRTRGVATTGQGPPAAPAPAPPPAHSRQARSPLSPAPTRCRPEHFPPGPAPVAIPVIPVRPQGRKPRPRHWNQGTGDPDGHQREVPNRQRVRQRHHEEAAEGRLWHAPGGAAEGLSGPVAPSGRFARSRPTPPAAVRPRRAA